MGRGGPRPQRDSVLSPDEILQRARLTPDDLRAACTPARVALAVRAEWWHGTREGAREQARVGVATFIGSATAWKAPALVYLAYGRGGLADLVEVSLTEIERECAARHAAVRAVTAGNLGLAATHLVELADVLGPIVALHPDPQLRALAAAAETSAGIVKAAADDTSEPIASAMAHAAGVRLEGWAHLGLDPATAPAALFASYDDWLTLRSGWDALPALELVMALDLHEESVEPIDRSEYSSLPPLLRLNG
jgi:hypothetical protein